MAKGFIKKERSKKTKQVAPVEELFRLVLRTRDGSLIVNREAHKEYYIDKHPVYDDVTFAEHSLRIEARERGVRLISWTLEQHAVVGIVEYYK